MLQKTQTLLEEQGQYSGNGCCWSSWRWKNKLSGRGFVLDYPQTKMHFKQLEEEKVGKPVVQIPPQAYIPIPMGIEKWQN